MTTQWTDEYTSEAIDDEIELARLKLDKRGVKPSIISQTADVYPAPAKSSTFGYYGGRTTIAWALPKWRRDWREAGALSAELGLSIRYCDEEGTVSVGAGGGRRNVTEAYADHPDRNAAACAAITRAAIEHLTALRGAH